MRITGRYENTAIGGEKVNAFIPRPLPPKDPDIVLSESQKKQLFRAENNIARLDLASKMVPSLPWFIYAFVRKEALLSSQIEGTQCTLVDLLRFESKFQTNSEDIQEVCNYLDAMNFAREELGSPLGLPISIRLLNQTHGLLMRGVRGEKKNPGEIRKSQNWIGGSRPGNASFVPPPPHLLNDLLSELETFIHQESSLHPLIKIALLHVQFETIHPYLDGNGRIGRLLITLLLQHYGLLSSPLLYLSLYFKRNRTEYYERLSAVRLNGDWEGWISFFLDGVSTVSEEASESASDIFSLIDADRKRVLNASSSTLASLRLFEELPQHPIVDIATVMRLLNTTRPTANKALMALVDGGVLNENTGRKRDRIFRYEKYLDLLRIGTELIVDF